VEISEFLERKLARRFQTFDFDGNGQIERSDFETSAGRVADEFGHNAVTALSPHGICYRRSTISTSMTIPTASAAGCSASCPIDHVATRRNRHK
jgi:hypothetical protein